MRIGELKISLQYQIGIGLAFLALFFGHSSHNEIAQPVFYYAGPIYNYLVKLIRIDSAFYTLLTVLLPIITGLLINEVFRYYRLIPRRSILILLFWFALLPFNPYINLLSPILMASPILLLAFWYLYSFSDKDPKTTDLINLSFIFSIVSLIYLPFVWFLLFLLLGLSVLRSFNTKIFFSIIVSFLVPYIYLFAYYFFIDKQGIFFATIKKMIEFNLGIPQSFYDLKNLFPALFIVALLIFSLYYVIRSYNKQLIQARRIISLSIFFLLFAYLISLVYISDYEYNNTMVFIPISIFLALGISETASQRLFYLILVLMGVFAIVNQLI